MKKALLCIAVFGSYLTNAQENFNDFIEKKLNANFIKYKSGYTITPHEILTKYNHDLGLGEGSELVLLNKTTDKLGLTHFRYEQYYKGYKVFGAQYLIHTDNNNKVYASNGKIVKQLNGNPSLQINSKTALENAQKFIGAQAYYWESAFQESLIKKIKKDPSATYYPTPELVWYNKYLPQQGAFYKLAYFVELYTLQPEGRYNVFVDAATGEVLNAYDKLHHIDVTGAAVTKYAGTQTIITDSVAPGQYRLRETGRGGGIETYNMQQGTNYSAAVDFTDADNYWNNVNAQQDEAATDAHWAAEMTYDYYFIEHGRDSYDNAGSTLISYVHYDQNYSNAFWNGQYMTYGDGNGSTYTALTSLDVGGHEISHGVTEYAANLNYQYESGALNESFSDIFGTAIEFWADPANADWFIGEDFDQNGNGFRSMSDPNSKGDPDTYLGNNWEFGSVDNGGVHTNSGVQNYWFYLLSDGGNGINDNGHPYNVTGAGIDTAAQIAYRNLTVYLTPTSQYADARAGAIQSAEDLYGVCSTPVYETAKAWYAVGVGFPIENNDLTVLNVSDPFTKCGLTNNESVTIQIRNNGCSVALNPGDTIYTYYKADNGTVVNDTLILSAPFNGGDTISFTFSTTADFSTVGNHTIDAWINFGLDPQLYNDTLYNYTFEHKLQQNVDVGMVDIVSPKSGCNLSNMEPVKVAIQFFGCDSLAANDSIKVGYSFDAQPAIYDTIVLANALYPGDTLYYTFNQPVDVSVPGTYTLDAWTAFDVDTFNTNDLISGMNIKHIIPLGDKDIVTFENNAAVVDTFLSWSGAEAKVLVSNNTGNGGGYALQFTGGDVINYTGQLDTDLLYFWDKNLDFAGYAKFCVDATTWTTANLRFDLRQTFSKTYAQLLGQPLPIASSLRILVNGTQIGPDYNPTSETSDPYSVQHVNLNAYAGTQFEVVFETRMFFDQASDPLAITGSKGDNAFIDNIMFSEVSTIGIEELEVIYGFKIYPNPNNGLFNIQWNSNENTQTLIEVYDLMGKLLFEKSLNTSKGSNTNSFDFSGYSNGVYFVKITSDNDTQTIKWIKN
ncbi:MAG: hypothetical protein Kow0079_05680 [Vicingaceae bacterium]